MFESETSHFSFLDFLSYLLPGALSLIIIKWVALLWNVEFAGIKDWVELLEINTFKGGSWLLNSMWLLILSYFFGHVVTFLASMTVEVFSHMMYKYPSDFLLMRLQKKEDNKENEKKEEKKEKRKGLSAPRVLNCVLCILIGVILAPISVPAVVLGRWLGFEYYYLKPLDEVYAWNVNYRFKALIRKLRINPGLGEKYKVEEFGDERVRQVYNTDFHRIAYNYEYEKTKQHQNKLDSYIALYSFMRAVAFLSVVLFWLFVYILTKQSLWKHDGALSFMLLFSAVPYILFVAFMKFYRRHTLETFMCLIVDEELSKVDISKPLNLRLPTEVDNSDAQKDQALEGQNNCGAISSFFARVKQWLSRCKRKESETDTLGS